ncbi:MAG: NifB/NifX family molybdenum-iron cluster-binding protein [Thiohalomonadaceae bacterium]
MSIQRQLRVFERTLDVMNGERHGLKIAFATSDMRRVDQHFGSAERFVIYSVEPSRTTLLEVAQFGSLAQDGNENKLLEKLVVLEGCAAVYCQAVGGSAVRQLLSLGVQPFKVPEGTGVLVLLNTLQQELRAGTGWATRALARMKDKDDQRFDAMEAEGWEE